MKKEWLSKLLSITLAGAMLVGVTACGQQNQQNSVKPEESSKAEQSSQTQSSQQASSEPVVSEPEVVEVTYPLDTDITFTLYTTSACAPSNVYSSIHESPWHNTLAEKTGVDVNWQLPPAGSSGYTNLNLLLAEKKDRPEVWDRGGASGALKQQWIQDDVILELTEYLPLYAPDFWEYINSPENEAVRKAIVDDEGRYWFVPSVRESAYNITYQGPIIRKDWLDECGLEIPVTIDDMEKVLIAFKEKYGAAFAGRYATFKDVGFCSGTGAMGCLTSKYYVDDNGKIQHAVTQPEWKEYMTYLNRWQEMGLIDADFFTADDNLVRQKALNNEAGVIFTAMSQLTNHVADAEANNTGAEWIGIEYLRTAAGEPTSMIQTAASTFDNVGAIFINSDIAEEKIPVILNWLNYFFTEEGVEYANFGEEGLVYTKDANGEIVWTDLIMNDPAGRNAALQKYTGWTGTGIGIQSAAFVRAKNVQQAVDAVYKWIDNTKGMDHCVPSLSYTPEETEQYTDRNKAIKTYVAETTLKFMTGEMSLDKYDEFVAELNKLGLQEVLDAFQSAYDRFAAK